MDPLPHRHPATGGARGADPPAALPESAPPHRAPARAPAPEPDAPTLPSISFPPVVLTQPLLAVGARHGGRGRAAARARTAPRRRRGRRSAVGDRGRPHSSAVDPMVAAFGDDPRVCPRGERAGLARRRIVTVAVAAACRAHRRRRRGGRGRLHARPPSGPRSSTPSRTATATRSSRCATPTNGASCAASAAARSGSRSRRRERRRARPTPCPSSSARTQRDIPPLHTPRRPAHRDARGRSFPTCSSTAATRMRIADAPGFRFEFRDPSSSPADAHRAVRRTDRERTSAHGDGDDPRAADRADRDGAGRLPRVAPLGEAGRSRLAGEGGFEHDRGRRRRRRCPTRSSGERPSRAGTGTRSRRCSRWAASTARASSSWAASSDRWSSAIRARARSSSASSARTLRTPTRLTPSLVSSWIRRRSAMSLSE